MINNFAKLSINKWLSLALLGFLSLLWIQKAHAIEVAITVDDLPAHGPLPPHTTRLDMAKQMLAVFKKHHIQNVYGFVIGKKADSDDGQHVLKTWLAQGQLLGNHTFSHPDLAKLTSQQYIADIEKNEPILSGLMANKNYKYFRYPYLAEGNTQEKRNSVRHFLFKNHYAIAEVTMDFFDYEWNEPYVRCLNKQDQPSLQWLEQSYLEQAVGAIEIAHGLSEQLFNRDIKYILLIHIGACDVAMLDKLLTAYEKKGVKFISLPDALRDSVYKINPNIIRDRAYTLLNQIRLARGLKNPENVSAVYASLPEDKLSQICR